jgi:hypothetical protein
MPRPLSFRWLPIALIAVAAWLPAASAQQLKQAIQTLMDTHANSLVTVKYVLKDPSGSQQREMEATGVMVAPDGLVLCANTRLGGTPFAGSGMTPTEIKVLIGDDTEGLDAEVIGTDKELDLGWVKITEELPTPPAYLDLGNSTTVEVGDRAYFIRKLDKYFDRCPVVIAGHVAAKVAKPRAMYVPSPEIVQEQGLPVFTESGQLFGFFVVQFPDAEARQAGSSARSRDVLFILPAEKVAAQTALARERYDQEKEEAAALEALEGELDGDTDESEPAE